jgi:hypothetical protein
MKPKEKAKELVGKFLDYTDKNAKQCAIICADEFIKSEKNHCHQGWVEYYQQVKTEIENL